MLQFHFPPLINDTKVSNCIEKILETVIFNHSYVLCILDFVVISLYVCQYVCVSVCVSVGMFPRREVISQPIIKYDTSTDAYLWREGASENRFEIKPDVKKLFRKNLITHCRHHVLAQKCTHQFGIGFPSKYVSKFQRN